MTNSDLPRAALEEGWKGALTGGALGALAGGIPGAVAGAAMGHAAQNRMKAQQPEPKQPLQRQRRAVQAQSTPQAGKQGPGLFDKLLDTRANREHKLNTLLQRNAQVTNNASYDPKLQSQLKRGFRPEVSKATAALDGPGRLGRAWNALTSKPAAPAAPAQQPAALPPAQPSAVTAPAPQSNAAPAAKEPGTMVRKPFNPNYRQALKSMSKPKAPSAFASKFGERVRALKSKASPAEKPGADVAKAATDAAGKYERDTLRTKYRDAIKSGDANAKKGFEAFKSAGGSASDVATTKAARDAKLKTPTLGVKEFTPTSKSAGDGAVKLPKPEAPAPVKRAPPKGGTFKPTPLSVGKDDSKSMLFPKRKKSAVANPTVASKPRVKA